MRSKTILKVLNNISKAINNIDHQFQIIIINDGSTDDTDKILLENKNLYDEYLKLEKNSGKGYALSCGFQKCDGDIVIIQDADLEYDPSDYKYLISPFIKLDADVVYGSRFKSSSLNRFYSFGTQ